jgi:hypothetical protein
VLPLSAAPVNPWSKHVSQYLFPVFQFSNPLQAIRDKSLFVKEIFLARFLFLPIIPHIPWHGWPTKEIIVRRLDSCCATLHESPSPTCGNPRPSLGFGGGEEKGRVAFFRAVLLLLLLVGTSLPYAPSPNRALGREKGTRRGAKGADRLV